MDLTTRKTTTLTKPGMQTDARIYGDYIAYLNNHTDINLYEIKTSGADFSLAPGTIKMEPAISDRGVVWTDYRRGTRDPDIQMYDFKILADVAITNGPFNHTNPSISGDDIVWTDNRNGYFNVYLLNTATNKEQSITNSDFDHSSPDISGKNVIWTERNQGNLQVFLYNLGTKKTKQVTTGSSDSRYAMIDGDNIIWIDTRSGGEQIYLYDITTGKEQQITTVKSFKLSPVISDDKIVWIDSRSGEDKWDVYLYNLTTGEETAICTDPQPAGSALDIGQYRGLGRWQKQELGHLHLRPGH